MAYCPDEEAARSRGASTTSAKKACGICVRMPQPSRPSSGRHQRRPGGSRFSRICKPWATMAWLRRSCMSATKPTPQASRSWAGSYAPWALGKRRITHDERAQWRRGERSARGVVRVQPCILSSLPSSRALRRIAPVSAACFVPRYHRRPAGRKRRSGPPCEAVPEARSHKGGAVSSAGFGARARRAVGANGTPCCP